MPVWSFLCGKTRRPWSIRILEHVHAASVGFLKTIIGRHVALDNIFSFEGFVFLPLTKIHPDPRNGDWNMALLQTESKWIFKLQTHMPPRSKRYHSMYSFSLLIHLGIGLSSKFTYLLLYSYKLSLLFLALRNYIYFIFPCNFYILIIVVSLLMFLFATGFEPPIIYNIINYFVSPCSVLFLLPLGCGLFPSLQHASTHAIA